MRPATRRVRKPRRRLHGGCRGWLGEAPTGPAVRVWSPGAGRLVSSERTTPLGARLGLVRIAGPAAAARAVSPVGSPARVNAAPATDAFAAARAVAIARAPAAVGGGEAPVAVGRDDDPLATAGRSALLLAFARVADRRVAPARRKSGADAPAAAQGARAGGFPARLAPGAAFLADAVDAEATGAAVRGLAALVAAVGAGPGPGRATGALAAPATPGAALPPPAARGSRPEASRRGLLGTARRDRPAQGNRQQAAERPPPRRAGARQLPR